MADKLLDSTNSQLRLFDNGDGSYSAAIKLTGRKVEEIILHNVLAIRDTANHNSSYIDISNLSGKKYLHITNDLDQSVDVTLLIATAGTTDFALVAGQTKTITAGTWDTVTAADIRELAEPLQQLSVRLKCSIAPTTGTVTVFLEGVQT